MHIHRKGFPGGVSGEESTCQCRRLKRRRFNLWVRKIPWSSKWQPAPIVLPEKFHGQKSLAGYSPWGCKELDTMQRLNKSINQNLPSKLSLVCFKPSNRLPCFKMFTSERFCHGNFYLGIETGSWCILLCHIPRILYLVNIFKNMDGYEAHEKMFNITNN